MAHRWGIFYNFPQDYSHLPKDRAEPKRRSPNGSRHKLLRKKTLRHTKTIWRSLAASLVASPYSSKVKRMILVAPKRRPTVQTSTQENENCDHRGKTLSKLVSGKKSTHPPDRLMVFFAIQRYYHGYANTMIVCGWMLSSLFVLGL